MCKGSWPACEGSGEQVENHGWIKWVTVKKAILVITRVKNKRWVTYHYHLYHHHYHYFCQWYFIHCQGCFIYESWVIYYYGIIIIILPQYYTPMVLCGITPLCNSSFTTILYDSSFGITTTITINIICTVRWVQLLLLLMFYYYVLLEF
jgi:hypothetical protein